MARRDRLRGRPDAATRGLALGAVGGSGNVEDDDERAVGTLAEVAREDRRGAIGVGAGDGERIRQQRLQARRHPDPGEERPEPDQQHEHPVAEDDAGPTLGHARSLSRPKSVVLPVTSPPRTPDTEAVKRLAIVLFAAVALLAAPAGAAVA